MIKPIITIVIPARMASSRYPGKPLALISNLPLIEDLWRRSLLADVNMVVVATCDNFIVEAVESLD
jgi:3-deoxy-manno-octulosonate cytidylyltransferase (CMP-KDO synthetase)